MQPIERYGLIALVFLGITIAAACLWKPGDDKDAGAKAPAAAALQDQKLPQNGRDLVGARTKQREGRPLRAQPQADALSAGASGAQEPQHPYVRGDEVLPGSGFDQAGLPVLAEGSADPAAPRKDAALAREDAAPGTLPTALESAQQAGRDAALKLRPQNNPEARETKRTYVVQSGDTLSEIAERELGKSSRYKEIIALNPGLDPLKLRQGVRLVMPPANGVVNGGGSANAGAAEPAPQQQKARPSGQSGATYVVQPDDSLWKIAEARLGDGERYREIIALNPGLNPDRISAGQRLVLPASAKAKPAAARDDTTVASASGASNKSSGSKLGKVR